MEDEWKKGENTDGTASGGFKKEKKLHDMFLSVSKD